MKIPSSIILNIVSQYKLAQSQVEAEFLDDALLAVIRRIEVMLPIEASENAKLLYSSIYKRGDITKLSPKELSKKRQLRGKFMFEHFYPVNEIRRAILSLKDPTIESIEQIIKKSRVVWVTFEEDQRLSQGGFRRVRRDPVEAYRQCGIIIAK